MILGIAKQNVTLTSWTAFSPHSFSRCTPNTLNLSPGLLNAKICSVRCSLFASLSLILYGHYRHTCIIEGDDTTASHARHLKGQLIPFTIFFISVGAKPMAVTLPLVVILLLDVYPLRRCPDRKAVLKLVVEKSHYWLVAAIVSIVTVSTHSIVISDATALPLWGKR